MNKFILLTFLIVSNIFAQGVGAEDTYEKRKEEYQVNLHYRAGNSLIYDCKRKYYVCVNDDGEKDCREKRTADLLNEDVFNYRCAVFKKFESKEACVLTQNKMMEKETTAFCRKLKALKNH